MKPKKTIFFNAFLVVGELLENLLIIVLDSHSGLFLFTGASINAESKNLGHPRLSNESIQAYLPNRVYDPIDIMFNCLAAFFAIVGSIVLKCLWKKIPRNS